jgi:NitT/TauT family transport system substrate-binding protein
VKWVELGYAHIPPALDNGRVDAAFIAEPFLTILREGDRITLLTAALDIIPGTSTASYAALRSWARNRSAVLEAFLRAFRRGVDLCERDPQRMRDAMVKHASARPDLVQRIGLPLLRPTIRPADLLPLMELARRHGLLERDLNLERLLWPGGAAR